MRTVCDLLWLCPSCQPRGACKRQTTNTDYLLYDHRFFDDIIIPSGDDIIIPSGIYRVCNACWSNDRTRSHQSRSRHAWSRSDGVVRTARCWQREMTVCCLECIACFRPAVVQRVGAKDDKKGAIEIEQPFGDDANDLAPSGAVPPRARHGLTGRRQSRAAPTVCCC